ncbi:MAG: hypothetical protein KA118_20030 [Verrucomicrobia bacterium]|nr:hypothetical protein [Verrucomicrobiota bacterium]
MNPARIPEKPGVLFSISNAGSGDPAYTAADAGDSGRAASRGARLARRFRQSIRWIALGMAGCVSAAAPSEPDSGNATEWDTFSDTWVATDDLGRSLPSHGEVGGPRPDRTVGIFYFLWLGQHGRDLHDISKILAAGGGSPAWGPPGAFHFWAEPMFGYYLSDDAFVLRKHAQMLSDAGVDALLFDVTNGFIYEDVVRRLCEVFAGCRQDGLRVPQWAFLAHSSEGRVVQRLYDAFYARPFHPELWFRWGGKPLVLAAPAALAPALREFFTLRESWAWSDPGGWFGDGRDKWPWLDHHPQRYGWHGGPDRPEQIAVAAAQHATSNIGRSFHQGRQPPPADQRPALGLCFAEQWARAWAVDPPFVLVTGWNEWIAQRFVSEKGGQPFLGRPLPPGGTFFVDQFSQEFSRDIEPMRDGHGDAYYYQMVAAIRRYKGVRPLPPVAPRPVAVDARFDDWGPIEPEYRDTLGDPVQRDHPGWNGAGHYVNRSGRNDLAAAKVSFDNRHLFFYLRARAPWMDGSDAEGPRLYLDADADARTGWLGYDFVIRTSTGSGAKSRLDRYERAGDGWQPGAEVPCRAAGAELELAVPLAAIGRSAPPPRIDFKWTDHIPNTSSPADFSRHGDAAPNDRFNYRATLSP